MKERVYRLTLTTLSNLHVGSGETYQTFDYYIENNQFCYIDQNKLVELLVETSKENMFTQTILNITSNKDRDVKKILNNMGFNNLKPLTTYCYNGDVELNRNSVLLTAIDAHIRDYKGNAYIPGSSLKGFISNMLEIDPKEDKESGSYISVSDSLPLNKDSIWITRNGYYNYLERSDKIQVSKGQSNYIEFIRPNTKIEFILKIKDNDKFNIETLKNNIRKFNNNYYSFYQSTFYVPTVGERIKYDELTENKDFNSGDVFKIGKHTSFLTKTQYVIKSNDYSHLFNLIKNQMRFPRKAENKLRRHAYDNELYPTSLKLSLCPDRVYRENGVCSYVLEDITDEINN